MEKELFNPHSNEWLINKFDYYNIIRESNIAYYSKKYNTYVITRYDDVMNIVKDPDTFSSARGNMAIEFPYRFGRTLGASDNPIHDTLKNIVKNAYHKDNIKRISNLYRTKIKEYLENKSHFDFSDITYQTTAWAIAEILNLPLDKEMVKDIILDMQKHAPQNVNENQKPELSRYLMDLIKKEIDKGSSPPGPGIYQSYMNSVLPEKHYGMSLFTGPCLSGATSLIAATQFLILDLFRENKYIEVMNNKSLISNAIDESLRFNSSTGRFRRTVTKHVCIHGVNLKPGDVVNICFDAANRDPVQWDSPNTFNLNRKTTDLAFGHGIHSCLVVSISKALLCVFLEEWINIIANYKILTQDLKYVMTANGIADVISNLSVEKIN